MSKSQNLYTLNLLKGFVKPEYKEKADEVIELYQDRRIQNFRSAENLLNGLSHKASINKTLKQIEIYKKTGRKNPKYERGKFHVSCIFQFRIVNTDINDKRCESESRTRQINFTTPELWKNEITLQYIEFACKDEIESIWHEYTQDIIKEGITDIKIVLLSDTNLSNISMGYKKLSIKCLEQADGINTNDGSCVIDYLLYELSGKKYFKSLTRKELVKFFNGTTGTVIQIIEFAKIHKIVSVYAIDPLNNVFNSYVAENSKY